MSSFSTVVLSARIALLRIPATPCLMCATSMNKLESGAVQNTTDLINLIRVERISEKLIHCRIAFVIGHSILHVHIRNTLARSIDEWSESRMDQQ